MMILFEGLDKSGKSTLIKRFNEISHLPVFKNPLKPTNKMYDRGFVNGTYFGAYEALKLSPNDVIFDRSHITEIVYAQTMRGYKPESKFWLNWEEENKHNAIVVFIDTTEEILKKRFKDDKEEYVAEKHIKILSKSYENYFEKSPLPLIYIDGSQDKNRMLDQLVIQLKNHDKWTSLRNR